MGERSSPSPLTRRQVLAGLGGAAALGLAGGRASLATAAEAGPYDCIVLGAGIAGVTAARDLHRLGHRVLLLEGSERIGGRMFTVRDFVRNPRVGDPGRFPIEAGAEYIHVGDRGRFPEFFAELDRHGFRRRKLPKATRNRLAFPEWSKNPKKLILSLLRETNLIPTVTLLPEIDDYDRVEDMPAGEYVRRKKFKGKGIRLGRYTVSSHTPGELYDPAVDGFEPAGIATCAGAAGPVDTISVAGIKADELPWQLFYETAEYRIEGAAGGGESVICGYDTLPRKIADELRDPDSGPRGLRGEVLLGHRVERVERRGERIVVSARDAGGARREFEGRSALCTFSVGMLDPSSGQGDAIFGELLTEAKRRALASVRMGPITKFSLEFKKSHWGRKSKMTVMSHPKGCARTFFSAFPDDRRGPFVMTGLLMNQDHRIIHELDDAAAVQHLLDVLQSLFDQRGRAAGRRWTADELLVQRAPGVPNFNRQDWQNDAFALGGNSFIRYDPSVDAAAVGRLRAALRDPRESLPLFWAGEATAPAYNRKYQPLSVHGAYISGVEAAKDVARFLAEGADRETFRGYYRAERAPEDLIAPRALLAPLAVEVAARELGEVERYAAERTDGDVEAAALELFRTGLYLHENDPGPLRARPPREPAPALQLQPGERERRRLEEIARRDAGGDQDAALRALLDRGLRANR